MNANDWQAVGEIGSLALVVGGALASIVIALLRLRFVTRIEHARLHDSLNERLEGVEAEIGTKAGRDEIQQFTARLYACEQAMSDVRVGLAKTDGLLQANTAAQEKNAQASKEMTRSLERQIGLLVQHELSREPK